MKIKRTKDQKLKKKKQGKMKQNVHRNTTEFLLCRLATPGRGDLMSSFGLCRHCIHLQSPFYPLRVYIIKKKSFLKRKFGL